ncbi:hypothetical protein N8Z47_00745 [Salibacteraceae bacterium]|nr:hypothetical protein [Salibacteraceae bacterium]
MGRLRPSFLVFLVGIGFGINSYGQASFVKADSVFNHDIISPKEVASISISNNSDLNRLMITSTEPIDGRIELSISDTNGLLIHNTEINSSCSKLVTYPSAMLDTNLYKVSCTINNEVWVQMVYID